MRWWRRSRRRPKQRLVFSKRSTFRSKSSKRPSLSVLSSTRTPSSTSPSQDSVMCLAPGRSANSGTTPTVTPTPSLAKTMRERLPSPSHQEKRKQSSPAMSATGSSTTQATNGPSAPYKQSPGCHQFYDQRRDAGDLHHQALRALGNSLVGILHACLRHQTPTTNTPPGHTAKPQQTTSRLDKIQPWGI